PLIQVPKGPPATPKPVPTPPITPTPTPAPAPMSQADGTRIPSCVLVGKQLHNFALNDVEGRPWEFRKHRRGRLVLLDFWHTLCPPCHAAVPHLRILQEKYGYAGFEVVGIACEPGSGSDREKAQRVIAVAQRLRTNYPLLLSGKDCPV